VVWLAGNELVDCLVQRALEQRGLRGRRGLINPMGLDKTAAAAILLLDGGGLAERPKAAGSKPARSHHLRGSNPLPSAWARIEGANGPLDANQADLPARSHQKQG
jgi:hypothetical protein